MLPSLAPQIAPPAKIGAVPQCPNTQSDFFHEVRTYAGAGRERRTYNCTCGMTWNQKRPDKLAPGEDPDVRQSNRAALGGAKRSSREYKCGNCGEPKKGHVCTVGDGDVKRARTSSSPPVVVVPSPPPPMRCEQYDDMLKFTAPPTDAELLAFLRKYDLRPSEATDLYKSMMTFGRSAFASVQQEQAAAVQQEPAVAVAVPTADAELIGLLTPDSVVQSMIEEAIGEDPTPEQQATGVTTPTEPTVVVAEPHLPVAQLPVVVEEASDMDLRLDLDDLLSDACADCGDHMVGDDRVTCSCGSTVTHRFCFKLCPACN